VLASHLPRYRLYGRLWPVIPVKSSDRLFPSATAGAG
jgi:hypothetical protein